MSPDQVKKKRFGIFIHQSQEDMVPFQGSDNREFWQRAEDRNANTANLYAALGMTKYAAMEAFVRWHYWPYFCGMMKKNWEENKSNKS